MWSVVRGQWSVVRGPWSVVRVAGDLFWRPSGTSWSVGQKNLLGVKVRKVGHFSVFRSAEVLGWLVFGFFAWFMTYRTCWTWGIFRRFSF